MENPDEERVFIPPDYSDELKEFDTIEKEINTDIDDDDEVSSVDEGAIENILDNQNNKQKQESTIINNNNNNNFNINMGGFGDTPSWGGGSSGPSWGQNTGSVPFWQQQKQSTWGFGGTSPSPWGNSGVGTGQRQEIDRKKKVVFCDFLDVLVTTYDQNARPGLPPRDIYDLRPRFDVWDKIAAFNPERVFAVVQKNLIPTTNGSTGWELTLSYFCSCLSSYIKVPYTNCQIFSQNIIGQPKEEILRLLLNNINNPIKKEDIVYIGIYSGINGQSNRDIYAASVCSVDYVDLTQLLTNMY